MFVDDMGIVFTSTTDTTQISESGTPDTHAIPFRKIGKFVAFKSLDDDSPGPITANDTTSIFTGMPCVAETIAVDVDVIVELAEWVGVTDTDTVDEVELVCESDTVTEANTDIELASESDTEADCDTVRNWVMRVVMEDDLLGVRVWVTVFEDDRVSVLVWEPLCVCDVVSV